MNVTANLEIERKFLTRPGLGVMLDLRAREADRVMDIVQGYLAVGAVEIRIGLRRDLDWDEPTATLCFKQGSGLARTEIEQRVELPKARDLMALTPDVVRKRRYRFGRWEIDVYAGRHAGLVTAEVELEHLTESTPEAPAWLAEYLGEEVTENVFYKNSTLARGLGYAA